MSSLIEDSLEGIYVCVLKNLRHARKIELFEQKVAEIFCASPTLCYSFITIDHYFNWNKIAVLNFLDISRLDKRHFWPLHANSWLIRRISSDRLYFELVIS